VAVSAAISQHADYRTNPAIGHQAYFLNSNVSFQRICANQERQLWTTL